MTIDTSKLKLYKPGYVHSNDGPGYISMLAREDGEYVRLEDVIAITIALEQALTHQRGTGQWEVIVTGWTKADGKTLWLEHDGIPMFRLGAHGDIGTNRAVHLTTHPYRHTTPQPSADAVREDSARLDWIESQIREYGDGYTEPREAGWGIQWQQERPDHYWPGLRAWIDEERRRASGDELESMLSAASGEKGVG